MANQSLAYSFVGSSMTVERGLHEFIEANKPDELMVTGLIHGQAARLRSFEITAQVRDRMDSEKGQVSEPAGDEAHSLPR